MFGFYVQLAVVNFEDSQNTMNNGYGYGDGDGYGNGKGNGY